MGVVDEVAMDRSEGMAAGMNLRLQSDQFRRRTDQPDTMKDYCTSQLNQNSEVLGYLLRFVVLLFIVGCNAVPGLQSLHTYMKSTPIVIQRIIYGLLCLTLTTQSTSNTGIYFM
jgi:hypothetical protein